MKEQTTMKQQDFFSVPIASWTNLSTEMLKKLIDQYAVILVPFIELLTKSEQKTKKDQSCQE